MKDPKAISILKKLFPHEQISTVVEYHGSQHKIIEINNRLIFKSAKNNESSRGLGVEKIVLMYLSGKLKTCIPSVVHHENNLLVYKKVPGVALSLELYNHFTTAQKKFLIADLAAFLYELHHAMTPQEATSMGIQETTWPWPTSNLATKKSLFSNDNQLSNAFDFFIDRYGHLRNGAYEKKLIHDDLNFTNIIINEATKRLAGIIDFTDVAFDDPYFDIRMRWSNPPAFTQDLAQQYTQKAGILLNKEKIYVYYMATEFSRYAEMLASNEKHNLKEVKMRILHAQDHLRKST